MEFKRSKDYDLAGFVPAGSVPNPRRMGAYNELVQYFRMCDEPYMGKDCGSPEEAKRVTAGVANTITREGLEDKMFAMMRGTWAYLVRGTRNEFQGKG